MSWQKGFPESVHEAAYVLTESAVCLPLIKKAEISSSLFLLGYFFALMQSMKLLGELQGFPVDGRTLAVQPI